MTTIATSRHLQLTKDVRKKNGKVVGKPFYIINLVHTYYRDTTVRVSIIEYINANAKDAIYHKTGTDTWRFYKKQDALDLFLMARLVWP